MYKEKSVTNLDIAMKNMIHVQVVKCHKKLNKPLAKFLKTNYPFQNLNAIFQMLSSLLPEIKISARRKRDTNLLGKQNTISLLYSFRPGLHNNIIQIFPCFNSHKLKENRTIKYTLEEVKNRDLHISTLTVTYNYADIATLRRKNQNRSILEVYMTKKKKTFQPLL